MKIKGSGTYTDANNINHSVLGIGEVFDNENLKILKVSGNLSFEKLSCDKVSISGKCEGGSLSAQSLKVSGTCEGDSITAKNFSASGKVEVDSIMIEQALEITGKPRINSVTADEIIIATRNGSLGQVKCRKIKISDDTERSYNEVFGKNFVEYSTTNRYLSRVHIKNIEADVVDLENCAVGIIKCKNAFIGSNCAIEKLFVKGECKVAPDSTVNETIRI